MAKVVHLGKWRVLRSPTEEHTVLVKGQGKTISIEFGDMLHPFFEEILELGAAGHPWPFMESPGDFTQRLHNAMQTFPLLGAVRNVLIENPPIIIMSTPSSAEETWVEEKFRRVSQPESVARGYGGHIKC